MQRIYSLLKKYNSVMLDKEFLEQAFEILLEENVNLNDFVNSIKITTNDEDSKTLGNYRIEDKLITVYINNIVSKDICSNVNNNNILGIEVLKHELEHAKNLLKITKYKDDIRTNVVKLSLFDYCVKNGYIYPLKEYNLPYIRFLIDDNYDKDPGERIAEIESWKYIVNLLKNSRYSNELLVARSNLYYSYIRGYNDNGIFLNCPTYEFLIHLGLMRELKIIKKKTESKNYNFDTRITCGLPITYDEYNNKVLKKVKLKKRKID